MSRSDATVSLADAFVLLNDYLHDGGTRESALQRLVALAVDSIPDCDWAAITAWPVGKYPRSLASSDEIASSVDQLQYTLGDGPCLVAAADSEVVRVPNAVDDDRWPRFSLCVQAETPVRSVLSFHLVDTPHRSALNLYSGTAAAFDTDALTVAALFAAHARVTLVHAASADKATNLEHALTTSRQIGTAIGILMNVHKVTADQAFDLLRSSSQRLQRKLHDIAVDVTETGELPSG
jgi:hypothetical protein